MTSPMTGEKEANDAPCYLSSSEASAWAAGFNAAHDALAPILAEKEAAEDQAESFKAMYRQAVDWRDEKIAKLTTRAEDAEFAMSRIEKAVASAEARALAAEAALAAVKAENEAYRQNRHFVMGFNVGFEAACEQGLGPAALRAQGE